MSIKLPYYSHIVVNIHLIQELIKKEIVYLTIGLYPIFVTYPLIHDRRTYLKRKITFIGYVKETGIYLSNLTIN